MSDPYAEFSKPVGGNDPYAEFSKPVSGKPSHQAAVKALSEASGALDKQLAGLPEEARRIGRQKFNADPRIKDLVAQVNAGLPKEEPTTIGQLLTSAKQRGAALVKGVASIPDVVTEAVAGGMRLENRAVDTLGGLAMQAFGASPERIAAYHQAGAQADKALSQPVTVRRSVERVVAPPTDTAGKIADFGAEMLGGSLIPTPSAPPIPRAPTAPAAATPLREVVDAGQRHGVRVMTTDVVPPTTFIGQNARSIGEKIPFAGTGGTRAAQQNERVAAVRNVLREFGGDDAARLFDDAPTALDDVVADLGATRGARLTRLTGVKDAIIDGTQGAVSAPRAVQAIDDQIARLNGINQEAYAPVVAELESFRRALTSGKSLRQIEGNRKLLGDLFQDTNLAKIKGEGQKAIDAIYGPLRADMGDFIEANAGRTARGEWANANDELAAMAGELNNSAFRKVLNDAETTPENIAKILFSGKSSDVRRLVANLSPAGRARAQAATLQRAFDKAISADGGLSVERFVNNLQSLGNTVGVTFQGADNATITGLTRLLNATRRASAAAASPATGVQNMPIAGGFALGSLFGNAALPVAGIGGLLARAYESAPVRNALIGLTRTAPGSRAEQALVRQLMPRLAAIAANNNEVGTALSSKVGVPLAASDGEENE